MNFRSLLRLAAAMPIAWPAAGLATPFHASLLPGKVGSSNVAVVEPPVAHPNEAPCLVPLFKNATFGGNNVNFTYTPPAGCPGPYAAIDLAVQISLNAGIQYDRTGTIWIGGVPLWFGTTAEPSPNQAPSWNFDRDITDYTALLAKPQTGFVLIANYTNSTDTSIVTATGFLRFYPATATAPAPRVPDMVIPLAPPGGGTTALASPTDSLTITPTLPTNIVAAAMDVYLQGQSGDEFWYTCVPNALAGTLESCGGGAAREGEISIDGVPAGVAPVSPWIFTGGIDPYLWTPIPGVQTLDFKPFRVELSPFAGVLSSGAPHAISLSVAGANNYFSVAGAMFLYLDPTTTQVTGSVTANTLAAQPTINTTNTITTANGVTAGRVNTSEVNNFTITGNVVTSAGTTVQRVSQLTNFSNDQLFKITSATYLQDITQDTTATVQATASSASGTTTRITTHHTPLTVDISEGFNAQGSGRQATSITQQFQDALILLTNGNETLVQSTTEGITTADTLLFNSSFNLLGHNNQSSSASYVATGTTAPCFGQTITSLNGTVTADKLGCK